jgi:murein DD-endopeptidase MepM/ murein hydrolase activator NlpD
MLRNKGLLVMLAILAILVIMPACDSLNQKSESPVGPTSPVDNIGSQPPNRPQVTATDNIKYPINPWLPLNGYPFGKYDGYSYHVGDDCVRNPGTPIYALYEGYVRYARNHGGRWGYLMIVESHFNNLVFCTVYGHMGNRMYPGEGNWVGTGQYIGTVGSTADSGQSSPHLHLGVYGASTGVYPGWCCGYASSTQWWFNPTNFMTQF